MHRGGGIELLGDRDERHPMGIEQFDQLGEVRQRPCQTVDLVDDDDVNLLGSDVVQQSLQVGAVGRSAGVSAIVIAQTMTSASAKGLGSGSVIAWLRWLSS